VSVKTARYSSTEGRSYEVLLKNCGGTSKGSKIRLFDNSACDYLFIVTGADKYYLIPANQITAKNSIAVGVKYAEYEVHSKTLSEYDKEQRE
jgi:hypothetical protein